MNKYIGHPTQVSGVEEVTLAKGKGKGMNLLEIRNGKGLFITLSADRCMDISRISFKGDNMGYFAPSGYVAPAYYDDRNIAFLKSFTAGFLTTCGLSNAGSPCVDEFGEGPMHGTISNIPCDNYYYTEDDEKITMIELTHNGGEKEVINVNAKTYHKEIIMTEGETNTLIITATNINGLPKTRRVKFDNK